MTDSYEGIYRRVIEDIKRDYALVPIEEWEKLKADWNEVKQALVILSREELDALTREILPFFILYNREKGFMPYYVEMARKMQDRIRAGE